MFRVILSNGRILERAGSAEWLGSWVDKGVLDCAGCGNSPVCSHLLLGDSDCGVALGLSLFVWRQ